VFLTTPAHACAGRTHSTHACGTNAVTLSFVLITSEVDKRNSLPRQAHGAVVHAHPEQTLTLSFFSSRSATLLWCKKQRQLPPPYIWRKEAQILAPPSAGGTRPRVRRANADAIFFLVTLRFATVVRQTAPAASALQLTYAFQRQPYIDQCRKLRCFMMIAPRTSTFMYLDLPTLPCALPQGCRLLVSILCSVFLGCLQITVKTKPAFIYHTIGNGLAKLTRLSISLANPFY
jgi:hypothetical protein